MRHTRGVPKTKALPQLKALAEKYSQAFIAERVGVGQQSVSSYLRRLSRPEPEIREAFERVFGIPFDDWYTAAELRIAKGEVPVPAPAESGPLAVDGVKSEKAS